MNITLGKEFERRIAEKVEQGLYTSASEVIRDGLRLLFEKDEIKNQHLDLLRHEVARGFEQLNSAQPSKVTVMEIFDREAEQ